LIGPIGNCNSDFLEEFPSYINMEELEARLSGLDKTKKTHDLLRVTCGRPFFKGQTPEVHKEFMAILQDSCNNDM
jgi:hypothetical protein